MVRSIRNIKVLHHGRECVDYVDEVMPEAILDTCYIVSSITLDLTKMLTRKERHNRDQIHKPGQNDEEVVPPGFTHNSQSCMKPEADCGPTDNLRR